MLCGTLKLEGESGPALRAVSTIMPGPARLACAALHNVQALARLREEQAAVRAAHGDAITPAALKDMVWGDAMVKEALRR